MKRVLIIEDNADNMELLSFILESNGYTVIRATTGTDGVERAAGASPDLVMLDIQLPDIDGFEVLRRIRNSELTRELPVIAVTSYAMAGDRRRLLAAGCNGYIEKPINPDTIVDEIEEILRGDI